MDEDHWMPYLEARMLLIQQWVKEGRSVTQIYEDLQVTPMQIGLLCLEANKRNNEGRTK